MPKPAKKQNEDAEIAALKAEALEAGAGILSEEEVAHGLQDLRRIAQSSEVLVGILIGAALESAGVPYVAWQDCEIVEQLKILEEVGNIAETEGSGDDALICLKDVERLKNTIVSLPTFKKWGA